MKYPASLFAIFALPLLSSTAGAALIAGFNFNNATAGAGGGLGTFNTTGTAEVFNATTEIVSPASNGDLASSATINLSSIGGTMGGTANNNWGTFAGDLTNAFGTDVAGQALSIVGTGNNSSTVLITVSTTGYEDIILSYATRGTATGFSTQAWEYSTNGTDFTAATTLTGRNVTAWSTQSVDLSSIAAADNASTLYLRLTVSGATNTGGNNRIDNIQINGTVSVPEPAAVLLGSIGLIGLLRRRR